MNKNIIYIYLIISKLIELQKEYKKSTAYNSIQVNSTKPALSQNNYLLSHHNP